MITIRGATPGRWYLIALAITFCRAAASSVRGTCTSGTGSRTSISAAAESAAARSESIASCSGVRQRQPFPRRAADRHLRDLHQPADLAAEPRGGGVDVLQQLALVRVEPVRRAAASTIARAQPDRAQRLLQVVAGGVREALEIGVGALELRGVLRQLALGRARDR